MQIFRIKIKDQPSPQAQQGYLLSYWHGLHFGMGGGVIPVNGTKMNRV